MADPFSAPFVAPLTTPLVALVGGAGFIGTAVAEAFARAGWRIRIACRDLAHAQHLRPLGDVGQIGFVQADVTVPRSLPRAVEGADLVVNLVGILDERTQRFAEVQAEGAGHVARAAAAAGSRGFIHLSAIGADAGGESAYGRTKAAGEAAVLAAFPGAAIVRPSLVFGPEDMLTNRFAGIMATAPVVPVIAGDTKFQPVYVVDVAEAVVEIARRLMAGGVGGVFELGGPEILSMRELLARIAADCGRDVRFVDMPAAGARLLGALPGAPVTKDQLAMLKCDNVASAALPGLAELGVSPTPLSAVASAWLGRYRPGGRFAA